MRSSHPSPGMRRKPSIFILIISTLILISLAWSLPGCSKIFPKKPHQHPLPKSSPFSHAHTDSTDPATRTGGNGPTSGGSDRP